MEQFLSYKEIQAKCEHLNTIYEIDEEKFYEVVEHWADQETAIETKLLASFSGLLQVVSNEIVRMEDVLDMKPSCRMGCAFCCYFPIIVNEMEAKLMKKAIEEFPEDRRGRMREHLAGYYDKYGDRLEQLNGIDFAADQDFKKKYITSQVPCVMLDTKTNQCMAYEIRPIPCRTYMNYADPKVCEENNMPKETVSFEFLYEQYMGALNEFLQFLYEGGDTGFIDYPNDVYKTDYLVNWFSPKELR
ncbi:YkgJ family cysteine cluster protein [Oceanobacillus massiliensis]|uniref:YkgJ family cysteine cluster protein n=1 Tax=Oceanobacillus massiliensis TaxID=1465765 RepID=UPI000288CEDE|nr:YkgJ family cysteine cluster protein [Oceanobacillus massiliensis]